MCRIGTAEDEEPPPLTQTLWTWVLPLYARESAALTARENPPHLAFCHILQQHEAPCFWAWLHEVIPPWRGWEDGLKGREMRQHSLGVWGLRARLDLQWTSLGTMCNALLLSGTVTLLCVIKDGTWWSPKSFPALAFRELWMTHGLPFHFLSMALDLSFTPILYVLDLSPRVTHFRFRLDLSFCLRAHLFPPPSSFWFLSSPIFCCLEDLALGTSAFLMHAERLMADYGFSSHFTWGIILQPQRKGPLTIESRCRVER